ncbi:hypothetical protein [Azospirillum griseum]|uniref:Uncharacterized protein n=1 Tax=Azospirillum griseum TaxID=2496639 RepID=A0A3S0KUI9_9PROT|nr:hypothetical protein [Azospirillum griseum]RTR13445.1 hypothetical protein EJ903_24645 [Azospirillum griseum]
MDILIIEDQRDHADFISKLIRRHVPAAEVTIVGTLDAGFAMDNTSRRHDVAVVDLLLAENFSAQHLKPDQIQMVDGVRLSEWIFKQELCRKFLFITASDQIDLLKKYEFGGLEMDRKFLKKTDEEYPDELVKIVKEFMDMN